MYAELLQQKGACTIQASTARDALRAAIELHPDVVVTDVSLRGRGSGLALTRYLKRHLTPPIPVILLTCYLLPGATTKARRAGCDRFLAKPCVPDVLDTIRELLVAVRSRHLPNADGEAELRRTSNLAVRKRMANNDRNETTAHTETAVTAVHAPLRHRQVRPKVEAIARRADERFKNGGEAHGLDIED